MGIVVNYVLISVEVRVKKGAVFVKAINFSMINVCCLVDKRLWLVSFSGFYFVRNKKVGYWYLIYNSTSIISANTLVCLGESVKVGK